ncbi:MAG: septal ring lytic transglycosylase RlpA family protein [Reyranella sp.]
MPLALVSPRPAALTFVQAAAVFLLAASLGACGSSGSRNVAQRGSYKIGAPYKIDGVTYTPQEEFNHVETGVASWYGPGFHGKSTANGEAYDQSARTAAHRTLQMPAIVRVTNLDNGMSTVVRINDRGPFARSRIIDLSRTAAQELDIVRNGTGHVRIEQLQAESLAVKEVAMAGGGPAEQQAAVAQASSGRYAPAQAPVQTAAYNPPPPAYTQPAPTPVYAQPAPTQPVWANNQRSAAADPAPAYIPASSGGATVASLANGSTLQPTSGFYVQTGAFTTPENAERQRDAVSSYGASAVSQASAGAREVYRVRLGPYTTSDAAGIVADRLKRSGYGDARVVAN